MSERAFTLELHADGSAVLFLRTPDRPLNIFTSAVLDELGRCLREIAADPTIKALVLASGDGRSFVAGADLKMMAEVRDRDIVLREVARGQRVFAQCEALKIPVVAAIGGVALGGGLEFALTARARIASDARAVKLGLPETMLGILPAWGGTQRLPRLIGLAPAIEMILQGKTVDAERALAIGLIDEIVDADALIDAARQRALQLAAGDRSWPRRPRRSLFWRVIEATAIGRSFVIAGASKAVRARTGGRYPAPLAALAAIAAGVEGRDGFALEAESAATLLAGDIAHRLIDFFLASERARSTAGDPVTPQSPPIQRIAVIGGGVMGAGIVQQALLSGYEVALREVDQARLTAAVNRVFALCQKAIKRRVIRADAARAAMERLRLGVGVDDLGGFELIIEAIVERLELKHELFASLDRVAPRAILASNTSSLQIAKLGERLADPSRLVGLHFFNPVHRMPLVEVVRSQATGAVALARALEIARGLGKTPIVVADRPGFLVNRLLMPYLAAAMRMVEEGIPVDAIDAAATAAGLPMGPLALLDEIGLDVADAVGAILHAAFGERIPRSKILVDLVAEGALGKKSGRGFYKTTKSGRARPRRFGQQPATTPSASEIFDRLLSPLIAEAKLALFDERIVGSESEVELAMTLGAGFPPTLSLFPPATKAPH